MPIFQAIKTKFMIVFNTTDIFIITFYFQNIRLFARGAHGNLHRQIRPADGPRIP